MREHYPQESNERSTQVRSEIQMLANVVAELEAQPENLQSRLQEVLIDSPPQTQDTAGEESVDELVPLAKRIRSLRQRLVKVHSHIDNIIQRVEL